MRRSAPSVRFVIALSFPHNPMNAFKSSSVSRSRHSGSKPSDSPAVSIFFFVSANTDAVLQAMWRGYTVDVYRKIVARIERLAWHPT